MNKFRSHINPVWFVVSSTLIGMLPVVFFIIGLPELSFFPLVLLAVWCAFCYPLYYVIGIAALVPLSIQINDVGGGLGISLPTEPLMIFFFGLLVLRFVIRGEINLLFFRQPIVAFTTLYLFWYFVTTLTSTMIDVSIKSFVARMWFTGIFFYFLTPHLSNKKIFKQLLFALIAGGSVMVLYTLIRHSGEGFVRLHSYTIMRPFFSDHGSYAAYIALFVPILFAFSVYGNKFKISIFWRTVLGGLFVIFLFGILFSYTRATWLSIIAMVIFGALIRYGMTFRHMVIALAVAVSVFMWQSESILYELSRNKQDSAEQIEDHIKSVSNISTDPSNMERINRWKCAVEMTKEKPVFGFGPYTYTFQYAPYQRPEDLTVISTHAGTLGNAHSEYFMAMSEMGIPGLLLVTGLFLASLYIGMKLYRKAKQAWVRILAASVTLGLFTYYIHGLLNNYSEYDKIGVPMWSFLAILTALDLYHAKYKEPKEQPHAKRIS